jgi:outer membrane lipoprotein carrier protein
MRRVLMLGAVFAALSSPLRAQTAESVIDKAVAAYKSVKTMRGTFEQTLRNPLTGTTMNARGEFQQRLPDRIAVNFTDPKGDRIIVNGAVAWLYLPSTNPGQALKVPSAAGGGSMNLTEQFLTSPTTRFRLTSSGTAMIGDRATHAVTLVPKTEIAEFTQAIVWVDDADGLIRQFEITEPSGLVRRIRMVDARVNATVDANAFTFTPPKGVKVIDQTGAAGRSGAR